MKYFLICIFNFAIVWSFVACLENSARFNYEKTTATGNEKVSIELPENYGGTGFVLDNIFSLNTEGKSTTNDNTLEKWIFYGGSIASLIVGFFLVQAGKHMKLGAIALGVSGTLFACGFMLTQYPAYLLSIVGTSVVSISGWYGWNLWRDYADSN